jgi:phosphoribosylformylglycinamidine (FGAM) synthase-like enzyme
MLFGPGRLGAEVDLSGLSAPRLDALLFGESQGRVLVCAGQADLPALIEAARSAGVPVDALGSVTAEETLAVGTAAGRLEWPVAGLRMAWETSIETVMKRPGLG